MPAGPVKSARSAFDIPSLDGVRAVAVLTVFIGHGFTIGGPWPGDVGVTIFFFLSGFLITTLLRREYARAGRIALGKFYLRRALRILPPAYITIALTTLAGIVAQDKSMNVWGVGAELLNLTNYYMIWAYDTTGDAHTGLPPSSSMLWSLAVEEHFYLIFPAVLIVLLRKRLNFRTVGYVLLAACLAAPIWRVFLAINGASSYRLYIATDTRFDGLLFGAAMALLWNPALADKPPLRLSSRSIRYLTAPLAVVVFCATALAPSQFGLTVGDTILYACLVPIFWYVISYPAGRVGRVLNNRLVRHIGVLSFSIYLLHRLVLETLGTVIEFDLVIDLCALAITITAAQVMYLTVEKPLGKARRRLEARLPARQEAAEN